MMASRASGKQEVTGAADPLPPESPLNFQSELWCNLRNVLVPTT